MILLRMMFWRWWRRLFGRVLRSWGFLVCKCLVSWVVWVFVIFSMFVWWRLWVCMILVWVLFWGFIRVLVLKVFCFLV